ncbi:MAG: lysyl oxidase family protein [Nocardioides sp.]
MLHSFARARRERRSRVASLTAALVALAISLSTLSLLAPAPANAAYRGLKLIKPTDTVTGFAEEGGQVYFESALFMAAYGQGYEFWTKRPRYSDPVTMTQTVIRGKRRTTTKVPAKLVDGFDGFKNGLVMTVKKTDGTVIDKSKQSFCPGGGYDRQRVDQSGPTEPIYPACFGGAWFTKASVSGIERGWAVSLNSFSQVKTTAKKFTVTTRIRKPVADFLGLPKKGRTVTQTVEVSDCEGDCEQAARQSTRKLVRQAAGRGVVRSSGSDADLPTAMRPTQSAARRATPKTTAGKPPRDTLPDMISVPAWGISASDDGGTDRLNFNANEWSAGPGTLAVEGFRRGTKPVMDAYQIFYRDGKVVASKKTATMEYHRAVDHDHWHYLDFAKYDLVKPNGTLVTTSGKQSWCLAPTDPVDQSVKNAVWNPDVRGLESSCGDDRALWLRLTLPTGWGDTYSQYQTQAFDLTGVPNGTYQIKITVNPTGSLFEKTRKNNVSLRTVKIGGRPGARTVTVPPYQGIDTEVDLDDDDF